VVEEMVERMGGDPQECLTHPISLSEQVGHTAVEAGEVLLAEGVDQTQVGDYLIYRISPLGLVPMELDKAMIYLGEITP